MGNMALVLVVHFCDVCGSVCAAVGVRMLHLYAALFFSFSRVNVRPDGVCVALLNANVFPRFSLFNFAMLQA